jgi:hypothetical protein
MLLTDAINIKDAFVVNIGVNFDIIISPNYLGRDVLLECTNLLKDYFDITKWNINQPIDYQVYIHYLTSKRSTNSTKSRNN